MSCHNRNLIYAITCSVYGELYIVETGNTLRERKRINKQHINLPEYRINKTQWSYLNVCGKKSFPVFPFIKCASLRLKYLKSMTFFQQMVVNRTPMNPF